MEKAEQPNITDTHYSQQEKSIHRRGSHENKDLPAMKTKLCRRSGPPALSSISEDHPIVNEKLTSMPNLSSIDEHRRMKIREKAGISRNRSALILIAIVLLFMITHSYRLLLRMYEALRADQITLENYLACQQLGRYEYKKNY